MKITRVTSQVVRLPADEPLAGGRGTPGATRDFVVLKVTTADGIDGIGVTYFGGAITGALACAAGASVPSAHHQTPSATSNTATPKSACQGRRALGLARSRPGGSASWLLSPGTRPRSRSAS